MNTENTFSHEIMRNINTFVLEVTLYKKTLVIYLKGTFITLFKRIDTSVTIVICATFVTIDSFCHIYHNW